MKKLVIPARLHLQNQQANLIQTLQMAEAFQKSADTLLVSDKAREDYKAGSKSFRDIVSDYGIVLRFKFLQFNNFYNFIPKTDGLREKYAAKKVARITKDLKLDYCFTRFEQIAYTCCPHIPTIFELHDIGYVKEFPVLQKYVAAGNIKILAISNNLKKLLIEEGIEAENIYVFHDAVNPDRFQNPNIKPLFTSKKKVVGYSGHLYKDRGIEFIIKSARNNPEFEFYIAGGHKKDLLKYKEQASNLGIGNLNFLGMLPFREIPSFLKACDYLLMPYSNTLNTIKSCSPLKVFEYMASGKVIITSNIPTILEVLNNHNSLIFKADDYESLQEIFNKIKENKIDEKSMVKSMLEEVKKYTWDQRAKFILDIFSRF